MIQRRKPIRRSSPKRAKQNRQYSADRAAFLARPENKFCAVAKALGLDPVRATQIHHQRGRIGRLLLDQRWWIPVSMAGHRWIEDHPAEARVAGLLCEKGKWNTWEP